MKKSIIFVMIIFAVTNACNINKQVAGVYEEIPLDAGMLFYYFNNNQADAVSRYSGKELLVDGKIVEFYKDKSGINIVILAQSDNSSGVECQFPIDFELDKPFKKGEILKIRGKCDGFNSNVIIKNCEIVK
jgi:hypothetical protein